MNYDKARRIQYLRTGPRVHSLRRIAEIIEEEFPEYPELSGNQLHGMELVGAAMELIYGMKLKEIPGDIRDLWDR